MTTRLNNANYMKFPLTIGPEGSTNSTRGDHVREAIETVLFTRPGERWFRPEFGIGVNALVFEPNNSAMWELTKKRLLASLAEALAGEVDPSTLEVTVEGEEEKLLIVIAYMHATLNHTERLEFSMEGG